MPRTTFESLVEIAAAQHGFVRTADLDERGISPVYLRKLAADGRAEHRGHALYRLVAIPVSPRDEYQEAVLWAGDQAAVAGQAALDLWELADVNPRQIDVVVPRGRRVRRKDTGRFRIRHEDLSEQDIDFVDGIRVVTPAVAIRQALEDGLEGTLVQQAISTARAKNLLNQLAEARLRVALADRNEQARTNKPAQKKVPS